MKIYHDFRFLKRELSGIISNKLQVNEHTNKQKPYYVSNTETKHL